MYLNICFLLLGDGDDSKPMGDGEQMGDDNGEWVDIKMENMKYKENKLTIHYLKTSHS